MNIDKSLFSFLSPKSQSEKGESLVSLIIASAIISTVVVSSLSLQKQLAHSSQSVVGTYDICREAAQNTLQIIRSNGTNAKVFKAPIDNTNLNLRDSRWHSGALDFNPEGVQYEYGLTNAFRDHRWPNESLIRWTGGGNYRSNAPRLIQSSMNALSTVYSANSGVCTNAEGLPLTPTGPLSGWAPPAVIDNNNIQASIRIRPVNLRTGNVMNCSPPIWTRPYATIEPPEAVANGIINLSGYTPDRGFEVEVFVVARHNDGQEIKETNCSVKDRFQYDRQHTAPLAPDVSFSGGTLRISLPDDRFAPGSQAVCRAHSNTLHSNLASQGIFGASQFSTTNTISRSGGWTACNQMRICGRMPTSSNTNSSQTSLNVRYNIPDDCVVQVEVRTMDVVGNLSFVSSANIYDGTVSTGVYQPSNGSSGGPSGGWSVNGMEFETAQAAQRASAMTGIGMVAIDVVTNPADLNMNRLASGFSGAANAVTNATNAAMSAAGAAAVAGSALSSANGASHSSGAFAAAATAEAAAASAASHASAARAAANAAQAAHAQTTAAAAGLSAQYSQATVTGAVAGAITADAVRAAEEAAAAAEAAAEAARLAAEAARAAAEAQKAAEDAADDDDDD